MSGSTSASGTTLGRIGNFITRARNFTLNAVFLVLVVLVLVTLMRGCGGISLEDRQALLITPEGLIVEKRSPAPGPAQLLTGGMLPEVLLSDVVRAVDAAADDERIPAIVLNLEDTYGLSQASAETIAKALERFKAAGKRVVAYGAYYDQPQFLLASHANELYLHPMGQVIFSGYGSFSFYFKELFERLDVNVHVFRAGEFKSAVEPFTENSMSDAARLANTELVESLWQGYADTVAANRQMSTDAFKAFVSQMHAQIEAAGGDIALALMEGHLVDELLSLDELNARLANELGTDENGDYNAVELDTYLASLGPELPPSGTGIGLIVATGPVLMDSQDGLAISAAEVRQHIRDARADDSVRALVVRVDSPGGSAFASEIIRQELELTQLAGKPVVVSMADVAASGGYWIAATADRIIAHPTTITGSIGVFSLLPTFEEALSGIGVARDGVGTTPLSGGLNPLQKLSEPLARILQSSVENTYARFTHLVARGRDLPLEKVQDIAQGRVWIGSAAQELGLVDQLGGLDDAFAAAAELAGLERWSVHRFETPPDPRALLLQELMQSRAISQRNTSGPISRVLGSLQTASRRFEALDDPRRIYALCESCDFTWRQ